MCSSRAVFFLGFKLDQTWIGALRSFPLLFGTPGSAAADEMPSPRMKRCAAPTNVRDAPPNDGTVCQGPLCPGMRARPAIIFVGLAPYTAYANEHQGHTTAAFAGSTSALGRPFRNTRATPRHDAARVSQVSHPTTGVVAPRLKHDVHNNRWRRDARRIRRIRRPLPNRTSSS
jgi:hypothetical protein